MPGAAPEGYSGQISLGGATFTLAIDAGSFDRELAKAGTTAAKAASDIEQRLGGLKFGDAVSREFKVSGQGVLSLAYAVDDLQYGMHAVINNIPQVVAGLGLGAGMAGALGIVAVATQQVISHWDTLSAAFGGSQAALPTLSKDLEELAYQLKDIDKEIESLGNKKHAEGLNFFDQERLTKLKDLAHDARESMSREKAIESHGEAFANREATNRFVAATGKLSEGSGTLIGGLLDKMSQEDARKLVGDALRGDAYSQREVMDQLGGNPMFQGFRSEAGGADAAFERGAKAIGEELERVEKGKQERERAERLEGQQHIENQRAQLEDERGQIQKRMQASQEKLSEMKPSQMFGSTRDYLSAVSSGGANAIRKQQLDVQKAMKKELEKISEQTRKLGQARFG